MTLNTPRLVALFVLPNALFAVLALVFAPTALISIFNAIIVALATGVCVSFAGDAAKIMAGRKEMLKEHWLVLGIFTHWLGTDGNRLWSIAWRWLGQPLDMINSHVVSYCLFLSAWGAYFHLVASESIGEEKIPRARWVRYGALAAAAVFAALTVGFVIDRLSWAGPALGLDTG